jgi:hypothetical protein
MFAAARGGRKGGRGRLDAEEAQEVGQLVAGLGAVVGFSGFVHV